jgi:hypothetical protein
MNAKLNKRERRAAALLAHYDTCERLAAALGAPAGTVDGKKISVALLHLEKVAHDGATAYCNGETFSAPKLRDAPFHFGRDENAWDNLTKLIALRMECVFGKLPPGFFVNGDARGYALKIDPENTEGRALIESVRLHTDWGRNGILSPEITGD